MNRKIYNKNCFIINQITQEATSLHMANIDPGNNMFQAEIYIRKDR